MTYKAANHTLVWDLHGAAKSIWSPVPKTLHMWELHTKGHSWQRHKDWVYGVMERVLSVTWVGGQATCLALPRAKPEG